MFEICADTKYIEGLTWLGCYLSSGKHLDFYMSFVTVLALLAVTAPTAMLLGFGGAMASRARLAPLHQGADPPMSVRAVGDVRVVMLDNSNYEILPEQLEFFRGFRL